LGFFDSSKMKDKFLGDVFSDGTGILNGAPYEKWYLSGRLGGIPGIQRLDFELNYADHEVA
jgi:hypothetical protein